MPNTPCHTTHRKPRPSGYVQVKVNGKMKYQHRLAYEGKHGPISEGMELDHLCNNPPCCNPDHLEPVTVKEHKARTIRRMAPATHCKHGHEYTEANLYTSPSGRRICRTCRQDHRDRYKQRRVS